MQTNSFFSLLVIVMLANLTFFKGQPAFAAEDSVKKTSTYLMSSVPGTEKFEEITLLNSRILSSDGKATELKKVSHGLRKKAIFGLVPVRVYVAQFLAAQPEKLVRTEAGILSSIKAAAPVQLHLTFVRDLPGRKVADSFKEGLEANKINVKKLTAELTQLLEQIQSIEEFRKGQTFSVTAAWNGSQGSIVLEDNQKITVIPGTDEFIEQVFSIWFGKPADAKLKDLRKDLFN